MWVGRRWLSDLCNCLAWNCDYHDEHSHRNGTSQHRESDQRKEMTTNQELLDMFNELVKKLEPEEALKLKYAQAETMGVLKHLEELEALSKRNLVLSNAGQDLASALQRFIERDKTTETQISKKPRMD